MSNLEKILEVKELGISLISGSDTISIVNEVSFSVFEKEIFCIIGESGCGKTFTSLSILKLFLNLPVRLDGEIYFEGEPVFQKTGKELYSLRGKKVGMIFQEPMTALNPLLTVGDQICESVRLHLNLSRKDAVEHTLLLLSEVGIPMPRRVYKQYPHQLSGGMRQRVVIAIAKAGNPRIIIADEPTTALDLTIQIHILNMIRRMVEEEEKSFIFITHDFGVITEIADRIAVMYSGAIVEQGIVEPLLDRPLHPYTKGLLRTYLSLENGENPLSIIKGEVPNPLTRPGGCPFHPRCDQSLERCCVEVPPLLDVDGRSVRCWLYDN